MESRTGIRNILALAFVALCLALRRIWAVDFWWQFRSGELISQDGWPSVDVLSVTAAGQPWIEARWLFCWLQYQLVNLLGFGGIVWLKAAILLACFALLTRFFPKVSRTTAGAAVVLIALIAASQRFAIRPELVSFVMIVVVLWILRRQSKLVHLFWLLPLQLLWVNSHSLFFYGPLLVGLSVLTEGFRAWKGGTFAAAEERIRRNRLVLIGVGMGGLSLLNPYGVQGVLFPFTLFREIRGGVFKEMITEFRSPIEYLGEPLFAISAFVLLAIIALVSSIPNLKRAELFWLLLGLSQLYLALLSVRNIALFALVAIPWIHSNFKQSPALRRWLRIDAERGPALWVPHLGFIAICTFLILQLATDRWSVRQNDSNQFGWGIAESRYPIAAVEWLDNQQIREPVLAELTASSYLTSTKRKVFADPRLEVYGEKLFEEYWAALSQPEAFQSWVAHYQIRWVLLETGSRSNGMLARLPDWRLVYFDAISAIYAHRDVAPDLPALTVAKIDARLATLAEAQESLRGFEEAALWQRVSSPKRALALADFSFSQGRLAFAGRFLDRADWLSPFLGDLDQKRQALAAAQERGVGGAASKTEASPSAPSDALPSPDPARLSGAVDAFRNGDLRGVEQYLLPLLEQSPDDHEAWELLGVARLRAGRPGDAGPALGRALQLQPQRGDYRANLARCAAALGQLEPARQGLELAAESLPNDVAIKRDLALVLLRLGRKDEARQIYEQARTLAPDDPALKQIAAQFGD